MHRMLHCLAGKNAFKHTLEFMGVKKKVCEKVCYLLSFFLIQILNQ